MSKSVYLKREMTVVVNKFQSAQVIGEVELDQGVVLFRTFRSSVGDPHLWSEMCRILERQFPDSEVLMFPIALDGGPIYSSRPIHSKPSPLSFDTLAILNKPNCVAFVLEPNNDKNVSYLQNGKTHSYVKLLNFETEGSWVLRISRSGGRQHFTSDEVEFLNRHAVLIELAAAASARIISASIEAYRNAFQSAGRPFAVLDDTMQIVVANEHFETVAHKYFQKMGDSLMLKNNQDTRTVRDAVINFFNGRANVETILHHENFPCLAILHDIATNRHLISGRKLIGLELKGALVSEIQDSHMLTEFFGLTQREGDVAAQLSYGKNVGAIAACNGVSVGTVRVQLKAIFRKMGVVSQVELVSKVHGLR